MCLNPAWLVPGAEGWRYFTGLDPGDHIWVDSESGEVLQPFKVGCGKCIECLDNHRRQWSFRLMLEAKCWKENSFLTLTYADAPTAGVNKRDVQLFIKRLRKNHPELRIRYFVCGEYGSKGRRPHYHVVVFNYGFLDKKPFRKDRKGNLMYRSKELESLWSFGYSSVLPVNTCTLNYVTKDMQKLLPLSDGREPPFTLMSTKPGIGYYGWSKNLSDGKIWLSGRSCQIPRYFIKVAQRENLDLSSYWSVLLSMPDRDIDQNRIDKFKEREKYLKKFQLKS